MEVWADRVVSQLGASPDHLFGRPVVAGHVVDDHNAAASVVLVGLSEVRLDLITAVSADPHGAGAQCVSHAPIEARARGHIVKAG
jgi:hypothetical protein